ncbi:MAG: GFA family protein [Caulobacteraceae bacterium]
MADKFTGGCLCGAIRYSCDAEPTMAGHCHCEDCRRSSGSGHSSHLLVPEASVGLIGGPKGYARPADSGNIVTRYFCPTCGAALFSKNAAMPGMMFLRASSLDDLEVFKPQMHVYAARAASWDHRAGSLPSFDTMPEGM